MNSRESLTAGTSIASSRRKELGWTPLLRRHIESGDAVAGTVDRLPPARATVSLWISSVSPRICWDSWRSSSFCFSWSCTDCQAWLASAARFESPPFAPPLQRVSRRVRKQPEDRIDPGDVHTEVVCGFDRDERRLRDLVGGTPSLIEEVRVVRRNADQAAHVPSTEVVPNVPLSHRGTPRSSHRRGVTSGVRGTYVIGVASGAGLEGKDERFDALLLRCGQGLPPPRGRGDHSGRWRTGAGR
jgi:hypothetical protein